MKMRIFHGRIHPEQELDDWGFDGPMLAGIESLRRTYGGDTILFETAQDCETAQELTGWPAGGYEHSLEVPMIEDLIRTKDGYFADWHIEGES